MQDNLTKTNVTPTESSQHMTQRHRERPVKGSKQRTGSQPDVTLPGRWTVWSVFRQMSASMNNTEKEREKERGGRLSTSSVERVQMCSYHKSTPMMHCLGQSVGGQCSCAPERAKQL